jgi:hypothetical protein
MIWCPPEQAGSSREMISKEEASRLAKHAQLYETELDKISCLGIYEDMVYAHEAMKIKQLESLLDKAKAEAYEADRRTRESS